MKQSWLIGLLVLVLAGGALGAVVWVIRSEGNRMRESVETAADDAVTGQMDDAIDKGADKAGDLIDKAGDLIDRADPGRVLDEIQDILRDAGRGSDDDGKGGEPKNGGAKDGASSGAGTNRKPKSGDSGDGGSDPLGDILKRGGDIVKQGGDILKDPIGKGKRTVEQLDIFVQEILGLTVEEENEYGKQVHEMIKREHKLVNSPKLTAQLERLAAPIVRRAHREGITYRFFVVDDNSINAFSHLGGYIYMNRGLLNLAKSDAEVRFVLGHEIGHVDLKHCTSQMTYPARAGKIGGSLGATIAQAAYRSIALGYSEDHEFDADEYAYNVMRKLGHDHNDVLAFPRRMAAEMKRKGIATSQKEPENPVEAAQQEIENHFRTHPPMAERIERLDRMKA